MPSMIEVGQPVAQNVGDPTKLTLSTSPRGIISQKNNYHGIEVVNNVVWQGWEPGREYTKNIVLKNVNVKTQKVKYKVPSSRFFTTLYPKPVVLSAGTSFSLPVTFRPLEKVVYQDKVEFHTKDGSFDVPILAVLPEVDISVPDLLDFNMCAAKDTVETSFEVSNTGDLETQVEWKCDDPFVINPISAILKSKTSKKFVATFKPNCASVFEAEAVCLYGPEYCKGKTTKLQGIGKYPHILVSSPGKPATTLNKDNLEATVQFGPTPVGSTIQKYVELHNLAPVRAPYKVEHSTKARIDTVFDCHQKTGIVPALGSVKVPFSYSPNIVDATSVDYFNVVAIGNISKSVVKCTGTSKGPTVQLSSKSVNFMQIDLGETATRTVDLVNNSDVEAVFQFMLDCNESVFKFEKISGTLRPKTKSTIILKFVPQHPINYHRRITCMVHNQGPLFLDLLGTCHAEMVKPAVLLSRHLDRYKCHVERGLSLNPPEQLNELLKTGKLELDDAGCLFMPEGDADNASGNLPVVPPMDQYFNDGFHSDVVQFVSHVSFDVNVADFGNCQNLRAIENKMINITNHTKGKITVQWIGGSDRTFFVTPSVMDLPPLKSCTFQVTFKPNVPNQFYGAELECYSYYKSLRDYRLVEDSTHCPPWCSTLTCTGHTFQPNNETFLPRLSLDAPRMIFPAVNTKESTYRTLLLSNTGTTPIFYDVNKDPSNIFAVKPAKALLKGEHQIFVVKITPPEVKTFKHNLCFKLNDNEKYNKEVQLLGSAEAPQILLDTEGSLFFKQTCMGTASQKMYSIKNISRIPLRFEWKLNHADRKLLSVKPDNGVIQPNEAQSQTWSFAPDAEKKYVMKPSLIVWGQGFSNHSSGGKKKQFNVRAIGEGTLGDIKPNNNYENFGDVVVGSSASRHVVINNQSTCSLHYKLFIEQTMDGPYPEELTKYDKTALILETMEGILPARSKKSIMATVKPVRRVTYQFNVFYQLITPEGQVKHSSAQEPQFLCHIFTTGVFPYMSVTDARCYGSAIGISKKQLWNLFSLDNMNVCLDADPTAEELRFSVATRHSHARRPPVYTRAIMDFNFSSAPLGSEPCIVNLMFENPGTVATEWAFLFPTDLQLELEYWAETGEFDEDELHEMKVMDNKLFTIEPKKGTLEPGECQTVTLKYKHTMAGTDRLPVLLKLARGREILLNFIGVTVDPDRRYIHFPSNKHMFTPVAVGEKNPPKQVYELYNGGALPVQFSFDLAPLDILKQENYDQAIFECLNPVGEIPPGRSITIDWRFSPIETKTYMVDVPIHVHNGDTAIVTFTGVGYDRRIMGDSMPINDQQDMSGVPSIQSAEVPGQLAYLSQERLSFGNLPLFSRARRMVFVTNRSRERCVSFEWHVTAQTDSQYMSISPIRGDLEPGESKMCRIVFVANGAPSFYDLDLVCEITDETEMSIYKDKLKDWEKERERQKYEFTITEHDLDADKRLPKVVEIVERPPSKIESVKSEVDGELTRYKTLPPIKQLSPDEEKAVKTAKEVKETVLWEKPCPPTPFILHLGLTARTHDIREFQTNFPEEYRNFYVDRMLSAKMAGPVKKQEEARAKEPNIIRCTQAEADVVTSVLSNVLRGLLDDTYFHEAVKKVTQEPIPYYNQVGEHRSASAMELRSKVSSPPATPRESRMSMISSSDVTIEQKSPRSIPPTPSSPATSPKQMPSVAEIEKPSQQSLKQQYLSEVEKVKEEERKMKHKQSLKKLPEFGNVAESIMENTILNIMSEALSEEFNITARPRFIALPRRTASGHSRHGK